MVKSIWSPEQVHQAILVKGILRLPNIYVTPNFGWKEVLVHQTDRPNISVLKNLFIVTRKLQAIRDTKFKNSCITITAGWRSHRYNENLRKQGIPAAIKSYHIDGMALDFTVSGFTPRQVQKILDPIWNGGLEFAPTWTHIDIRPYKTRFDNKGNIYKVGEYFK